MEHSQSARRTGSRRRATSGPGAPGARRRPPQRAARSNEPLSLGLCAQFRGVETGGKRRANRILSLEDDVVDFAPAFDEIAANADAAWLALQRGCGGVISSASGSSAARNSGRVERVRRPRRLRHGEGRSAEPKTNPRAGAASYMPLSSKEREAWSLLARGGPQTRMRREPAGGQLGALLRRRGGERGQN